jgi:hypothetical protein
VSATIQASRLGESLEIDAWDIGTLPTEQGSSRPPAGFPGLTLSSLSLLLSTASSNFLVDLQPIP